MTQFKEGDRVVHAYNSGTKGVVKAVYMNDESDTGETQMLWILWDQGTIPSTYYASNVKLVPKIPEVGKVYGTFGGAYVSPIRRKVIGIVPEGPHVEETIVVYIPLNSAGLPCGNYLQTLGRFWSSTPHLID